MSETIRRFGDYEVFALKDGVFEAPVTLFTHRQGEAAREQAIARWERPTFAVDVNCFLLRGAAGTGLGTTLIDAGAGKAWGEALGHAGAAMQALGVTPAQVDRVLLTHLHGDHALGLFDDDRAVYPHAEILVPQTDLAFFTDPQARDAAPEEARGAFDIAATLLRVYGDRVRPFAGGEVLSGVTAVPLPGHTPGQTGYLLADPNADLLLWADALHLASLQPGDPEIGLAFDHDGAEAARTRRAILDRAAREAWVVAGAHVTGFSRVVEAEGGWRLQPA